jgi:hypothetical protein
MIKDVGMNFSEALAAVKVGCRIAREGWNGKGMFVYSVPGSTFEVNREPLKSILGEGAKVQYNSHLDMKTADGSVSVWVPSQNDLFADDWMLVKK